MAKKVQNPVIVVPGITASSLRDTYDVDVERVWTMLRQKYDRIALHPDDVRYERHEPTRVRADQVFGIPYEEMIQDLRHDLSPSADRPTPVYPFAYDWRQPLDGVEDLLGGMVDEVIERTSLLPHYFEAGWHEDPRVDLVGHSMGGLIIAGYLQRYGREALVGKVASVGSPFRGSFEAVIKITTGLSTIGGKSASREREMARVTPALYHLLPSFDRCVELRGADPSARPRRSSDALFTPSSWQGSVVETMDEYFRLYGRDRRLTAAKRRAAAATLFEGLLRGAGRHRRRLESLSLEDAGMTSKDWLCLVGVGERTRVGLSIGLDRRGEIRFDLSSVQRKNDWTPDGASWTTDTGDGTVPYLGARCSFIPKEQVVCLADDDFGYWELADRALEGPAGVGLHGMLPEMNVVQKLIVSHLRGINHSGVWGRRSPELPSDERVRAWDPPIKGLREKWG